MFAGGSASPGDPDWNGGFKSFRELKKYLGSPGKGNQWHHIVEQCQIKKSGFEKEIIHNVNNIISMPEDIHRKLSAYYNSIDKSLSDTMKVRDWLATHSFEFQYNFGIEKIKEFGGTIK